MKCYRIPFFSSVLCLFLLACASCQPFMARITSKTCSDDSSSLTTSAANDSVPSGWARYAPAGLNLSLALPGEPRPTKIALPENFLSDWKVNSYTYKDGQMFAYFICNTRNNGSVTTKLLKDMTEGFIKGYKKSPSYADAQFSTEPVSPCRISIKASYRLDNRDVELEGFSQAKDSHIWILIFTHTKGSSEGKTSVNYAEESVKLD